MRTETRVQHLTDAEFSRLLDGAQPGASVDEHLTACELCRQEFEIVQDSLGSFRSLTTVWAEMEAPRHVPVPARWLDRLEVQHSWSAGFAATAITGLLAFWLGFVPHTREVASPHAQTVAPTNAELAADNSLLLSIDTELSDQTQPVVSAAELHAGTRHSAHREVGSIAD